MPTLPEIPQNVRAYIYRVIVAAFAVGVLRGWVKADELEDYLGLAAALLAVANTSTKPAA